MERARTWLPRGVAAAAFALYALTAPAGLYWLDAGELTAAAAQLGVPHASGFPLYVVLGKLATLIPVGSIPFRLNLLSAVCAALAVLWTARLVIAVAGDPEDQPGAALAGAAAAGATLAVSLTFFRQATVAEVYAPTAALIAGTLLLYHRVARGGDARVGLSLAIVAGLGLGAHGSYRLLLGLPIAALLAVRLYRGARWPLVAPTAALIAGVGVHLYLPVRSLAEPTGLVDWGHPASLGPLWRHANASGLREAFGDRMFSGRAEIVGADAARFFGAVLDHLGPVCLLAAAVGLVVLALQRRQRWTGLALGVVALGDALYGFWINPMGIDDLQNGVPLALATCALAGVGVAALGRLSGRGAPYVGGFAAVAMAAGPAMLSVPAVAAAAEADRPRRSAETLLELAPPGAVVATRSDSASAAVLYAAVVENARPDVAPIVRQLLPDRRRTAAALSRGARGEVGAEAMASLAATGRPLVWELADDSMPAGLAPVELRGAAALLAERQGAARPATAARQLAAIFGGAGDRIARRTHAQQLTALGRLAFGGGDLDTAARLFSSALAARPGHGEALINLGVVHSRRGEWGLAARATEAALALDPNRDRALVNAARYRLQLGDRERARAHVERALRVAPESAPAWSLAGILDAQDGDFERARERLERALELRPGYPEAARALRQLGER